MALLAWLTFGRLVIWTLSTSDLIEPAFRIHPKLVELRECSFCIGWWVMTPLAWVFGINLIEPIDIPVLSEILTGLAGSFGLHLAETGWRTKWGITDLGEF